MSTLRNELKSELDAAGLLGYHPAQVYAKFALLTVVTGVFFAGAFLAPWWLRVPLFVVGVCFNVGLVMIGHDSGHGAVSRNAVVNDLPGYLTFPLLGGLSLPYWRYKHNTLHHSYPNVEGKDPDVTVFPMAMSANQRVGGGWRKFVHDHQAAFFWPLTAFTTLAMRFDSFTWHLGVGKKIMSRGERAIDLACLVGHCFLWLVVPPVFFHASLLGTLVVYVGWAALAGMLLGAIFIPAHMTKPVYAGYTDNFTLQLETTQDLKTNWLFSYLLIGLDYQVEHHLFQKMSHLNVKKAAPIVEAFCQRKGLPYHTQGWGAALVEVTRVLGRLPDVAPTPLPPARSQPAAA